MKTAEEILKSKLYPKIIILNNPDYTFNKIIEAMEEYRSQCDELPSDEVIESFEHDVTNEYGASMSNYQTMSGFKGWEIGMKQMRSIASPFLASKDARIRELEEALKQAVDNIKVWHDADDVWNIYYNNAPEMKNIRNVLHTPPIGENK